MMLLVLREGDDTHPSRSDQHAQGLKDAVLGKCLNASFNKGQRSFVGALIRAR